MSRDPKNQQYPKRGINVVLVDGNERNRTNLVAALQSTESLNVVGEYNEVSAISGVAATDSDVVLVVDDQISLNGSDAPDHKEASINQVNLYSVFEENSDVFDAVNAVNGYRLREVSLPAIGAPSSNSEKTNSKQDPFNLTRREREIMGLVAKGFQNQEVGDLLNISVETVRGHLRKVYRKMDVSNRAEAAVQFSRLKSS